MAVKHVLLSAAALLALAACENSVPQSNPGPGFSDYSQYAAERAAREAALTGQPVSTAPLTAPGTTIAPSTQGQPAISASELAAVGINQQTTVQAPLRGTGVEASPSNASPELSGSFGLSDENDFAAVSARETIESDAARRAELAAQYQVVQPTALPTRDSSGPNIVQYALNAPNRKGQEWYSRFKFSGEGRFQRNCASYASADAAQRDFLARGGPDRDPRGIDPDGDGFACGWDPAPFIAAARATGN